MWEMMYSYDAMQLNGDLKTVRQRTNAGLEHMWDSAAAKAPSTAPGVTVYISLITYALKWRHFCARSCGCVHVCMHAVYCVARTRNATTVQLRTLSVGAERPQIPQNPPSQMRDWNAVVFVCGCTFSSGQTT